MMRCKDCLKKQANGELSDAQKEFMAKHQKNLADHGITHDEKGELRRMTPEEREAAKLNNNQNSSHDSSSQVSESEGKAIGKSGRRNNYMAKRPSRGHE